MSIYEKGRCEKCGQVNDLTRLKRTGDIDDRFDYRDVYLCPDCGSTTANYSREGRK